MHVIHKNKIYFVENLNRCLVLFHCQEHTSSASVHRKAAGHGSSNCMAESVDNAIKGQLYGDVGKRGRYQPMWFTLCEDIHVGALRQEAKC